MQDLMQDSFFNLKHLWRLWMTEPYCATIHFTHGLGRHEESTSWQRQQTKKKIGAGFRLPGWLDGWLVKGSWQFILLTVRARLQGGRFSRWGKRKIRRWKRKNALPHLTVLPFPENEQ